MDKKITDSIIYIGVDDKDIDLFESQYVVPNGVSYNSYVIMDDKIAIMDTADARVTDKWFANLREALGDRKPDYLVVSHLEPDHASNIQKVAETYPDMQIVGNAKTFNMMGQFFDIDLTDRKVVVAEGDKLSLGKHELTFVMAPMVHWPEVMMEYESTDKVLFSADGFGKFGALDTDEDWTCEARRYYFNIVGKYGAQVQAVLKKAAGLDIEKICPLHGPILTENLGFYIDKYNTWSFLIRLFEKITHLGSAHTNKHLHKFRTGYGEEGDVGFSCHRPCKKRLAGSGRAHQQHALGNPGPQRQVLLGVLQELHDLPELLLLLIGAGHVVESDLFVLVRQHPGPGGAEFGHLVRSHATSLGPNHQEVPHQPQDHRRQQEGQQLQQPVGAHRLRVIIVLDDTLRILLLNQVIEVVIKQLEAVQLIPHGLAAVHRLPQLQGQCAAAVNGQPRHFFLQEQLADLGVFQLVHMVVVLPEPVDTQQDHEGQQYEAQIG